MVRRAKCGRQGGGTGVAWDIGAGVLVSCDNVGDNICCWTIALGGNARH